jgi:trk system potassium uptake protein TrkH
MDSLESVSYAARPQVVGKYLGQLLFLLGGFSIPPLLFAAACRDWPHAAGYAVVVLALMVVGWLLQRRRLSDDIQVNEALIVVSAIFVIAPLAMALPMMTTGVSFLDALFEAISGITTTGLSTFTRVQDKPLSVLFAAAWLQWLGGIGIMVLSFALLVGQSASAKRLTGVLAQPQGVWGSTRAYASVIIRIYATLTVVGILALWLAGAGWFPATTLTFSAVSTGGFSPLDASLAGSSATIQSVVILLCIAGASSIPLFHDLLRGSWKNILQDSEFRALLVAGLVVASLLIAASVMATGAGHGAWDLLLTAFSAQTTAGFSTVTVGQLDPFSKVVLIIAMAIGGSVGSSAGGIKLLRLIVMVRLVQLMTLKTRLTPHAAMETRIAGRQWSDDELVRVLAVAAMFAGVVLISWLLFLWAGYPPLDALFEVTSASGTVGLSTGITGPALPPLLKGLLCLDMLLGRLEILPVLVLLAPRTWFGHRRELQSVPKQ